MTSGIDAAINAKAIINSIYTAANSGACFYFAPEMGLLLDRNRPRASASIYIEAENPWLPEICMAAKEAGIWVHLGSAAVRYEQKSELFANRTLLINDHGELCARYDKMHLFDVDLATGETWRESSAYRGGDRPVLADTPLGLMGLTICYDMRFPDLYTKLMRNGAQIFAIPAAFTVPTGIAHWHILLRARAIETAAFVVAAAQSGKHEDGRITYGHSLVVDPWGEVLLDMGEREGLGFVDIDLSRVDEVRSQIPVHRNWRDIPAL